MKSMKRILIMGLPGSGKTTLAKNLQEKLKCSWFNADDVREKFNDWDFSPQGRMKQAIRMRLLADQEIDKGKLVICDFVAPLPRMRIIFNPDILIWVDTISESEYIDTNKIFVPPEKYDLRVTTKDAIYWTNQIVNSFLED